MPKTAVSSLKPAIFHGETPGFPEKTGLDRSSLRRKTPHLAKLQRSDGDIPFNGFQSLVQLRILNG
jgi:hypothetical protein